jgi:hypothetical protein
MKQGLIVLFMSGDILTLQRTIAFHGGYVLENHRER